MAARDPPFHYLPRLEKFVLSEIGARSESCVQAESPSFSPLLVSIVGGASKKVHYPDF